MCEFDQNEDTFLGYFDELEHYLTKNDEKQHTRDQEKYPGYTS